MKSQGKFVEVPASAYPPIRQAAVVLRSSRKKALARQFLAYIRKPQQTSVLRQYGFVIPSSAK
jgi:molybdate transport system substrate-binding protein